MSFEEVAKRTAGSPEAAAHQQSRAAELARKPFNDAFLAEIYPHWQGPLVTIAKKPGVVSCMHGSLPSFPLAENATEALNVIGRKDWVISQIITVSSVIGPSAVVAYTFAGDTNDGAMAILRGYVDRRLVLTGRPVISRGPLPKLIEDAVSNLPGDVDAMGGLLLAGLEARAQRLAKKEADRQAAEEAESEAKRKAAAELKAKAEAKIEAEAADVRRRKAEAEAAAGDKPPA